MCWALHLYPRGPPALRIGSSNAVPARIRSVIGSTISSALFCSPQRLDDDCGPGIGAALCRLNPCGVHVSRSCSLLPVARSIKCWVCCPDAAARAVVHGQRWKQHSSEVATNLTSGACTVHPPTACHLAVPAAIEPPPLNAPPTLPLCRCLSTWR